jgi:CBS domain-containing protein
MTTVGQVLDYKGHQVHSVTPGDTVFHALEIMAEKDVGALLVTNASGKLVGIFSERDYARKVILKGRTSKTTSVGELMTTKMYVVGPDRSLEDCLQIMTIAKVRHLPVVDGEKVVGIITIGDVGKNLISQHEFTIQQLERYIMGPTYPGT